MRISFSVLSACLFFLVLPLPHAFLLADGTDRRDPRILYGNDPKASALPPNTGTSGGVVDPGDWSSSGVLSGFDASPTLWSNKGGATAVWKPNIDVPGKVRVSFLKLCEKEPKNGGRLKIEIVCRGKTDTHFINGDEGVSGWVELGVYDFEGKGDEIFRTIKETPGGVSRVGPFLVEMLKPVFQGEATSTARLIPAMQLLDMKQFEPKITFADMENRPEWSDVAFLVNRDITVGADVTRFHPDKAISGRDFLQLFEAVMKPLAVTRQPSSGLEKKASLTWNDAAKFLNVAIDNTGRNTDWLDKRCLPTAAPRNRLIGAEIIDVAWAESKPPEKTLTRVEAFVLAKRFLQTFVLTGPPTDRPWKLTFEENFDGNDLNGKVWASQNGPSGHILSSRWKENVEVADGLCKLIARKETRAGQQWTAASIWVKNEVFQQKYGYWEARYRYGAATGLNQSFWMHIPNDFEIDVNEGHWPNEVNTNLHWHIVDDKGGKKQVTKHEAILVPEDLSADFHTYACEWNEREIVYYFDGKELLRKPTQTAHRPLTPILSLAVIPWAGPVTDAIHGKSMDVDWVRVYTPVQSTPAAK